METETESPQPNEPKARAKPGPKTERRWITIEKPHLLCGRNKKPIDPDEVEMMASLGCPDAEIARHFGVSHEAIRYNFTDMLVKGRSKLNLSLRQAQLKLALSGNPIMLIWLGKNILGQLDSPVQSATQRVLPFSIDEITDKDLVDEELGSELREVEDQINGEVDNSK